MTVWVTRHGPIFLSDGNQRLALRWTAAEPGMLQYPFHRYRSRAKLAGVHGVDFAPAGTGIELRVCRRGRQYRLPRGRRAAAAPQLSRRRAGGWLVGQLRVGRVHSVRRVAERLQSAERDDCFGQPEYVSRELSLPRQRKLRAALPRSADPRAALRAQRMARRGHADRAEGYLFGVQPFSGGPTGEGI